MGNHQANPAASESEKDSKKVQTDSAAKVQPQDTQVSPGLADTVYPAPKAPGAGRTTVTNDYAEGDSGRDLVSEALLTAQKLERQTSPARAGDQKQDARPIIGSDQAPPVKQPDGKGPGLPSGTELRSMPPVSEKAPQLVPQPTSSKPAGSDGNQSRAAEFAAKMQGAQPGDTRNSSTPSQLPSDAAKVSAPVKTTGDSTGVSKALPTQSSDQMIPQSRGSSANQGERGTGSNQGDRSAVGDNTGRKVDSPNPSTVGAAYMPPAHVNDTPANAGVKGDLKTDNRLPVSPGPTITPESQGKSVSMKSEQLPVAQPGVSQQKVEPPKAELPAAGQQKIDQPKFEPAKGSDVISTQGSQVPGPKQDAVKAPDAKFDGGRPIEQPSSKEPTPFKDPKSAGVLNETFGTKSEPGSKLEPSSSQGTGIKQDAGAKAEQITKGIEGRVNEGAKQPSADTRGPGSESSAGSKQPSQLDAKQPSQSDTRQPNPSDVRQPSSADGSSGGRQPGIETGGKSQSITDGAKSQTDGAQTGVKHSGTTDSAGVTGKQPGASESSTPTARQPLHEAGDKPSGSGGGGGGNVAESTKKIDISAPSGGKADGQPGAGGMGGGSSAPIDRAPHKPFSVEDAQPSGNKSDAGMKGDAGMKSDASAGGKSATGGTGPRFDTGEVRGNEPGARFDTGEVKDGRGTLQPGGFKPGEVAGSKGGDSGVVKGTDAGNVKGTDVSGVKPSSGGAQGVGGSGGSDGGILSDKRQPSLLPDGMVNQGGKPGKLGDGVSGGSAHAGGDESVPFILPGAQAGKGGPAVSGKGDAATPGKADAATSGKGDATVPGNPVVSGKGDTVVSGRSDAVMPGRGELVVPGGTKAEGSGVLPGLPGEKSDQSKEIKDKGQKADAGIAAGLAGQVGSGAADVGSVLKNFAQAVLSDGKSSGNTGEGAKDSKAAQSPTASDGKEVPVGRQDFAGPGQKTRILDNQTPTGSDTKIIGSGGAPIDSKVTGVPGTPGGPGAPSDSSGSRGPVVSSGAGTEWLGDDESGKVPVEEFDLPPVDLREDESAMEQADDADESDKVEEADESAEAKLEDEMQYELALGLQLYSTIAEAKYGAYHYLTKEGDTVEGVARDVVGDGRCAPLVFSLNKEHILASTEYGVHPFKVGVMVQLPTPRELKEFFGGQ